MTAVKPIQSKHDYEAALDEIARLWGAKSGTHDGDRLDALAALIDAYEARHYPMDPPDARTSSDSLSPPGRGSG